MKVDVRIIEVYLRLINVFPYGWLLYRLLLVMHVKEKWLRELCELLMFLATMQMIDIYC